jgi:hypothetical protein
LAFAAAVVGAGLLAFASWATTHEDWDGGFPSGLIRLEVRATDGQPIPGADFRVYNSVTGQPSPGYPFLEPSGPTDAGGRLAVVQPHSGIQFGGHRWWLFWAIRMGESAPRYECEIAAVGFRPARVDLFGLFGSARRTDERVKVHWPAREREVELAVYDAPIVLER